MIAKLDNAMIIDINGKHILGKLIFFNKFELLTNTFCKLEINSENRPHVKTPEHKYILYENALPLSGNLILITSENTNV